MKSSLRADTLGRGIPPKVLEKVAARTIAGFMNSHGGLLLIGVDDQGTPLGLESDIATLQRKDLDGLQQTLVQVVVNYLGADIAAHVRIFFTKVGVAQRDLALIDCPAYGTPVFLKDGEAKEFHVRAGNTTRLMDVQEAANYISNHWKQKPTVDFVSTHMSQVGPPAVETKQVTDQGHSSVVPPLVGQEDDVEARRWDAHVPGRANDSRRRSSCRRRHPTHRLVESTRVGPGLRSWAGQRHVQADA